MTNEPMIVSATQRLYIECIWDGFEVSAEFKQSAYSTIEELVADIPDDASKVLVIEIEGSNENITELLAEAWLENRGELVCPSDAKPAYVEHSNAWYEYAHDNQDRY